MGKFYVHRQGRLAWTGTCPDGQESMMAPPGYQAAPGEPPASMVPPAQPVTLGYDMQRKGAYPAIGDQLDALWKTFGPQAAAGTSAEKMFGQIQAVKERFPKPSN